MKLLQKQKDRYMHFKELAGSYVELKNRRKAFSITDSKNNLIFMNENHSLPPEKNYNTKKTEVYRIDDFWSSDILEYKDIKIMVLKIMEVLDMFW